MHAAIPKRMAPGALAGVLAEFDRCWPWLEAAMQRGGDRHTVVSIWNGIATGQYQFWPGKGAAAVTQVVQYPTGNVLQLWLVGGDLDEILSHEAEIAQWARDICCVALQLVGRPGWQKVLAPKGYSVRDVVLTRRLDDGTAGDGGDEPG